MGGRDRWSSCAPGLAFLQHLPLGVMSDEADEMPQACLVLPKQPRVLGTVNWTLGDGGGTHQEVGMKRKIVRWLPAQINTISFD